jgi:hypothetical protein
MRFLYLISCGLVLVSQWEAKAGAITPEVEYTAASTLGDSRNFTLGYEFTISNPVTINALGFWNDGLDNNHQVGIWNTGGTLLVSTTVLGTDTIVGHFQWHVISNFALAAGTYVIGGEFTGGVFPSGASGITTQSGYTYVEDLQVPGAGLTFPTVTTSGSYGPNGILMADFSVTASVPEPGTAWYLSATLLTLPLLRRRMSPARP